MGHKNTDMIHQHYGHVLREKYVEDLQEGIIRNIDDSYKDLVKRGKVYTEFEEEARRKLSRKDRMMFGSPTKLEDFIRLGLKQHI